MSLAAKSFIFVVFTLGLSPAFALGSCEKSFTKISKPQASFEFEGSSATVSAGFNRITHETDELKKNFFGFYSTVAVPFVETAIQFRDYPLNAPVVITGITIGPEVKAFILTLKKGIFHNLKGKTLRQLLGTYYGVEGCLSFVFGASCSVVMNKSGVILERWETARPDHTMVPGAGFGAGAAFEIFTIKGDFSRWHESDPRWDLVIDEIGELGGDFTPTEANVSETRAKSSADDASPNHLMFQNPATFTLPRGFEPLSLVNTSLNSDGSQDP
jgi:hypothetical protein